MNRNKNKNYYPIIYNLEIKLPLHHNDHITE